VARVVQELSLPDAWRVQVRTCQGCKPKQVYAGEKVPRAREKRRPIMGSLFKRLILAQPSALLNFGGCSKDKDGSDSKEDSLLALLEIWDPPDLTYLIDKEKRFFIVKMSGRATPHMSNNLRDQHVAYLEELTNTGQLDAHGVTTTRAGEVGFKVIVASSPEEAKQINEKDPLVRAGYFTKVDLSEIKQRR
jgi:uncharacterized protein YciI